MANTLKVKALNSNIIKQASMAPYIFKEFQRTIELNPNHIDGHAGLGWVYLYTPSILGGDIEKAIEEAKILLKLDKSKGLLLLIDIYIKENKLVLAEKAYDLYDKSFDESTNSYEFYNGYGYFLLNQKKYIKAIAMFQKQVNLAPNSPNSYDSLGDGYRAAGKFNQALSEYKKAVEIDPNLESSLNNIQELEDQIRKIENSESKF